MLQKTKGIVLRSVKYGDSSLVLTVFTSLYGIQTYMVQGVRSSKVRNNRSGLLQPAALLDLVVYHKPQQNLQRIKEFQAAYLYNSLHEEIVKNSIAIFSVELLSRLLPEHAIMPELFDFAFAYFIQLDKMPLNTVANFPLWFIIQCSDLLGYNLKGDYTPQTLHLNLQEGGFTNHPPATRPFVNDEDTKTLALLLKAKEFSDLGLADMNSEMRFRLIDWYLEFLRQHAQHLGNIRSLTVLQTILH